MSVVAIILLAGAAVHAELQYTENFDTRPTGALSGGTATAGANGTVGVTNGTSSGNITVAVQGGSNVVNFASNTSGDGRGAGVYNMTDPIAVGEKGVVFFRFYADNSRSADYYVGIHARTTNINDSGLRTGPQNYIMAGFHLWSDGEPSGTMKMVSTTHTATFKTGLLRGQWYNCWIEADHAAETFNVYISTATAPAGAATLPNPADKVVSDRPFEVATAAPLAGMYAVARTLTSETAPWLRANKQTGNFRLDEIYWDGSSGLTSVFAQKPDPANGETGVAVDKVLSWQAPDSPDVIDVLRYDVYMDPNAVNVANRTPDAVKSAGQTATSFDPTPNMAFIKTYYWMVDTTVTLNSDPNDPKVPRVIPGKVWSFTTIAPNPQISGQPIDVLVKAGEPAALAVEASSPHDGELSYQWWTSTDKVNNTPADDVQIGGATLATYEIPAVALGNESFYYCVVSSVYNSQTYTTSSAAAALAVKRKVAHWTLDTADYVGGQYLDSSGEGHHADPNDPVVFVDGQNLAATNQAAVINPDGGWAKAGTWDPSQYSNQITVSVWVKWNGQPATPRWQGLLGKRSVFATDMRWQLEIGDNAASLLTFKSNQGAGVSSPILPIGEWEQVVCTCDGTTGRIYRNGTYVGSAPVTLTAGAAANLMIGACGFGDPATPGVPTSVLDGALDDIQIYNYPLDALAIAYAFADVDGQGRSACVDPQDPILVAYDVDGNCEVGLGDLMELAANWLDGQLVPDVVARP